MAGSAVKIHDQAPPRLGETLSSDPAVGWELLWRALHCARALDQRESELLQQGHAFFHVSGCGHEATAAMIRHLTPADYLHCHYRDKALLIARGLGPAAFLHGLLCNANSHSAGRQMSAHVCDPMHQVLSIVGPVGNQALQAVGVAAEIKDRPGKPIVLCSMGDGTSQQGEVLEAIAESVRRTLPVLFLVADNRYSISTKTRGKTWFDVHSSRAHEFYGLPIHRLDGRDVLACEQAFGEIIGKMRVSRGAALVVMDVERLSDHTNADDETVYRSAEEISAARKDGDPVANLRRALIASGASEPELLSIELRAKDEVHLAAEEALWSATPAPALTAKAELPGPLAAAVEYRGDATGERLKMADAIREVLRSRLATDGRVTMYGEDIEDPKGDVFGVTRELSTAFPGRVRNSPVSESTIVGTSIGRALAGGRPVAFIQFADFLPLAFNQIATELGSMFWRTNGGWQCPVILMVACGGYRPGLGPFHSHTLESVVCHVPGIDVAMPSTAADAAGILNAAFESGRPTIFFYPKALLNSRDTMTSADVDKHIVPVGRSRIVRGGSDLTLVAWGNTVLICEKVATTLASVGCHAEVIDLRWLSPWDTEAVCHSTRKTGKLIVVHEDNQSCGLGAEVVSTVMENTDSRVICRRVTRPDTYVPCNFENQLELLPSFKRVLSAAAELLDLELSWQSTKRKDDGLVVINVVGSSPADEIVAIVELIVKPGQTVAAGDPLATLECDKAFFDFASACAGTVEEIRLKEGQEVRVGTPLLTIRASVPGSGASTRCNVESVDPILKRKDRLRLR